MLILTKGLGVGVLSAAFKQEKLDADGYAQLIASTTQLNTVGPDLAALPGVHAMTDVTGFGLFGHALEMARGAGLTAELFADAPYVFPQALAHAQAGIRTGASSRNWASYGEAVSGAQALPAWKRDLLTDPQTSGGLLVAVDPGEAQAVLDLVRSRGFDRSAIVGRLREGPAGIAIREGAL
jgi:selenide,water dikinase